MTTTLTALKVKVPAHIGAAIQETAERTGRDVAAVAGELLTEAVKMQRFPGIVFADGATGRRARVGGTGIEVFEVIGSYRSVDEDWDRLKESFHWLSEYQLRAALAYAEAYPEEIEVHLGDPIAAIEALWAECPATRPHRR